MRYLSVCSGIEAASVAWESLGWTPVAFAEIEKFPSQVLAHRFPHVQNLGDMTKFTEWDKCIDRKAVDLIVGGTPCQAFSIAGRRKGLDDPRGNLALTFIDMVEHYRPEYVVWENVPGVLSSSGGRDFGSFVGALGDIGYGWAYRVLDAQYFGVPQRRRRVFLVAHSSGDSRRAGQILFEPESLSGNHSENKEPKGWNITNEHISGTVSSKWAKGTGGPSGDECYNLVNQDGIRRLTTIECERLQGFPDDYTGIEYYRCCNLEFSIHLGKYGCPNCNGSKVARLTKAADTSRYIAIGNSMAVPVMRWIGERINEHR